MSNYRQTRKVEGFIAGCMLFFVAIVVVAVCSFVSLGKARRKANDYDKMIASLKAEQSQLQEGVNYMGSQEYLESKARDHFGMIKDGENLYIFE